MNKTESYIGYMNAVILDYIKQSAHKGKATSYVSEIDLEEYPTAFWFSFSEYIERFNECMSYYFARFTNVQNNLHGSANSLSTYLEDFGNSLVKNVDNFKLFRNTDSQFVCGVPWNPVDICDIETSKYISMYICPRLQDLAKALCERLKTDGYTDILIEETEAYITEQFDKRSERDNIIEFYPSHISVPNQSNTPVLILYTINNQGIKKLMKYNLRFFIHWLGDGNLFWPIDEMENTLKVATRELLKESPTGYFKPNMIDEIVTMQFEVGETTIEDNKKTYKVYNLEWGDRPYRQRALIVYLQDKEGRLFIANMNTKAGKKALSRLELADQLMGEKSPNLKNKKKSPAKT